MYNLVYYEEIALFYETNERKPIAREITNESIKIRFLNVKLAFHLINEQKRVNLKHNEIIKPKHDSFKQNKLFFCRNHRNHYRLEVRKVCFLFSIEINMD